MYSLLRSRALADRAASRHDHSTCRNHHLTVLIGPDVFSRSRIEYRCRSIDDHACAYHCIFLDYRALIDTAVSSDEHVVLDDHRKSSDRFEHSAQLRRSREVHVLSDLGARAHKGMGVDHGTFVNICSYVYICRGHHDH